MLSKDAIVIPANITNNAPPSFLFNLLAVTRYRLRMSNALSTPVSKRASKALESHLNIVQDGILHYIDMKDQERWNFLSACVGFVSEDFCEFCYKDIPMEDNIQGSATDFCHVCTLYSLFSEFSCFIGFFLS